MSASNVRSSSGRPPKEIRGRTLRADTVLQSRCSRDVQISVTEMEDVCFVWPLKLCHTWEARAGPFSADDGFMSSGPIQSDEWIRFAAELGHSLHRRRMQCGLSQEDVAYAAGLSRYTYQKLEKGVSRPGTPANPSLQNVLALARVLRISLAELLPTSAADEETPNSR